MSLWNSAKIASGMVWVMPLKLPANMIVAPELAQRPRPGRDRAGDQGRERQGHGDPGEDGYLAGPVHHRGFFHVASHPSEPDRSLTHVEVGGHEDLGHYDRRCGEADRHPEGVEVSPHQPEPSEGEQERYPGRRRR